MSTAGFTYNAEDPGLITGRYGAGVLLEDRKMALTPTSRNRAVFVPGRAGSRGCSR